MPIKAVHEKGTTKVITGEVRLSYAHLFEKFSNLADAEPQYSTTILIPKEDTATIEAIRDAQQVALEAKFGNKIPNKWKDTLHDGDEEADLDRDPEMAGHYYMSVGNKREVGVVDRNAQLIIDSTEVYSGCYARVIINAYGYDNQSKGVGFGLQHVQKTKDGEALGGGNTKAEEEFEALDPEDGEDLI